MEEDKNKLSFADKLTELVSAPMFTVSAVISTFLVVNDSGLPDSLKAYVWFFVSIAFLTVGLVYAFAIYWTIMIAIIDAGCHINNVSVSEKIVFAISVILFLVFAFNYF